MKDRVAGLRADIERGPGALSGLLDASALGGSPVAGIEDRLEGRRLVFAGMGSSRYAALTAASSLRSRGRSAVAVYASGSQPPAPTRDTALIAISASGRTPEVVELAHRHRGTSLVVAVTGDDGSSLAREADVVLPLHTPPEAGGISVLTYRATVAVLGMATGTRIDRLRATVDRLAALNARLGPAVAEAADLLDGAMAIDVLADAAALGTAEQAALLLREAPRLPAHAGETGDWLHASVYLALPGHRALVYAGSASDVEVVATIARRGGAVVAVGPVPGATLAIDPDTRDGDGPFERAILQSTVADHLGLTMWERASASG